MKIICIGRNYREHAKELNHPVPAEPVFFLKPDSAILRNNFPFFIPSFSQDLHYEAELVFRIGKLGKGIREKFAASYIDAIGVGIDFTARDLQNDCKARGLPWEKAKAFDGSAPVSRFLPLSHFGIQPGTSGDFVPGSTLFGDLSFRLDLNGKTVQQGNSGEMIFTVERLLAHVSQFMTVKTGDLLFTGTPAGVGPVGIDDRLEAYLGEKKMLDFRVK